MRAVALSGPAHADQYDFISHSTAWVSYQSMLDMIDIGKDLFHDLRSGATPPVVLGKLQKTGFAPAESTIILISAVNNMCSDTKPQLSGGHATTATPVRCRRLA